MGIQMWQNRAAYKHRTLSYPSTQEDIVLAKLHRPFGLEQPSPRGSVKPRGRSKQGALTATWKQTQTPAKKASCVSCPAMQPGAAAPPAKTFMGRGGLAENGPFTLHPLSCKGQTFCQDLCCSLKERGEK